MLRHASQKIVDVDGLGPCDHQELIAIQRIRTCGKPYSEVPIVVVTASVMKGMGEWCLELGADGYVPKPVEIPLLVSTIARIFDRKNAREAA